MPEQNPHEWQPIETAPQNGTPFLCSNGHEMQVLNQPKGYALGRWIKVGREWEGHIVRFDTPTHWMPLPEFPGETPVDENMPMETYRLETHIQELSERYWRARWHSGIDFLVYRECIKPDTEKTTRGGHFYIDPLTRLEILRLALLGGNWVQWDDATRKTLPIPLDKWRKKYKKWALKDEKLG